MVRRYCRYQSDHLKFDEKKVPLNEIEQPRSALLNTQSEISRKLKFKPLAPRKSHQENCHIRELISEDNFVLFSKALLLFVYKIPYIDWYDCLREVLSDIRKKKLYYP